MAYHGIIASALEFTAQFEHGFRCLEKHFDTSAVSIRSDNF